MITLSGPLEKQFRIRIAMFEIRFPETGILNSLYSG